MSDCPVCTAARASLPPDAVVTCTACCGDAQPADEPCVVTVDMDMLLAAGEYAAMHS